MANYSLLIFFVVIVLAAAIPSPDYDEDGQEILKGRDTRYYGLPLFWYRRPLTSDDSDDYGTNNGGNYIRPSTNRRRQAIPNYASVGAGWGR